MYTENMKKGVESNKAVTIVEEEPAIAPLEPEPMPMTERVSSRLIKKERTKIVKQTVWFVVFGVILVLVFIFFVLPLFFRVIDSILNTNPLPEEESVILQAPVLVAPVAATHSAELKIEGIGQPKTKAVLVVNGEKGPQVDTADDGSFSGVVQLTSGENSIVAYTMDEKENESNPSRDYRVILDNEAPKLELKEPEEGKTFDSKQKLITVSGTTDPGVKLYLNDRFFSPKADGGFSTTFSLNDGENILKIRAIDQAGNQSEVERKVTFKP